MRRLCLLLAACCAGVLCPGCRAPAANSVPPASGPLTVSAAISLKDAFTEIGQRYETQTGTHVNFNFGASGVLQKQLEQAAPVDVFASAGGRQMDALAAQGLILPDTRHDFARNALVLIVPARAAVALSDFAQLPQPDVRRLAIGNPKTVPAGQYTEQLLTRLDLWPQLQSKLVLAEDVRQVLDYVARGEVEAGIVYASDVRAAGGRVTVAAQAPATAHDPILYPLAVVTDSRQPAAARRFVQFVLSPEGQTILTRYDFSRVAP